MLTEQKCVPCEGGLPPMPDTQEDEYIKQIKDWNLERTIIHKLKKELKFKKYEDTIAAVNKIAEIANSENHHPVLHVYYGKIEIELWTHAVKGLSINDFILAAKIDVAFSS